MNPSSTTTAGPVPIGHVWVDDDNPVLAIDPNRPQALPDTDVSTLRCVGCGIEPHQRRDSTGRLMYVIAFHRRPCHRLAALYASSATPLFDPTNASTQEN